MAKKRISFDLDIPNGHRRKPRKSSKSSRKAARKTLRKKASKSKAKPTIKFSSEHKEAYSQYKKRFLGLVTRFIEEEFVVLVEWVRDILSAKKKMRVLTWYIVLLVAGATVFFFGIAKYLDCVCTQLSCGLSYVLIGAIVVLSGLVYKKMYI